MGCMLSALLFGEWYKIILFYFFFVPWDPGQGRDEQQTTVEFHLEIIVFHPIPLMSSQYLYTIARFVQIWEFEIEIYTRVTVIELLLLNQANITWMIRDVNRVSTFSILCAYVHQYYCTTNKTCIGLGLKCFFCIINQISSGYLSCTVPTRLDNPCGIRHFRGIVLQMYVDFQYTHVHMPLSDI